MVAQHIDSEISKHSRDWLLTWGPSNPTVLQWWFWKEYDDDDGSSLVWSPFYAPTIKRTWSKKDFEIPNPIQLTYNTTVLHPSQMTFLLSISLDNLFSSSCPFNIGVHRFHSNIPRFRNLVSANCPTIGSQKELLRQTIRNRRRKSILWIKNHSLQSSPRSHVSPLAPDVGCLQEKNDAKNTFHRHLPPISLRSWMQRPPSHHETFLTRPKDIQLPATI